jgi:hypothetical protein
MLNSADNIYATTGAYTLMNIQYVNSASGVSGGLITSLTLDVTPPVAVATTTAGRQPSGHRPDGNRLNQGSPNNGPPDGYGPIVTVMCITKQGSFSYFIILRVLAVIFRDTIFLS